MADNKSTLTFPSKETPKSEEGYFFSEGKLKDLFRAHFAIGAALEVFRSSERYNLIYDLLYPINESLCDAMEDIPVPDGMNL